MELQKQLAFIPSVDDVLREHHYLGPCKRGTAIETEWGPLVISTPASRHIPPGWLELSRWCIVAHERNAGSQAWARAVREIRRRWPMATTVVSYSDPSAGHDGALYRSTGWLWAPTWHRLRPPPTGNGRWTDRKTESVKDRWVFLLAPDDRREDALRIRDDSITRKWPWVSYREPAWRRDKPVLVKQNEAWRKWREATAMVTTWAR